MNVIIIIIVLQTRIKLIINYFSLARNQTKSLVLRPSWATLKELFYLTWILRHIRVTFIETFTDATEVQIFRYNPINLHNCVNYGWHQIATIFLLLLDTLLQNHTSQLNSNL